MITISYAMGFSEQVPDRDAGLAKVMESRIDDGPVRVRPDEDGNEVVEEYRRTVDGMQWAFVGRLIASAPEMAASIARAARAEVEAVTPR